jgi:hypothetical protein
VADVFRGSLPHALQWLVDFSADVVGFARGVANRIAFGRLMKNLNVTCEGAQAGGDALLNIMLGLLVVCFCDSSMFEVSGIRIKTHAFTEGPYR